MKQRGFTYLGLLLFIALLGIASSMAMNVMSTSQRREEEVELLSVGKQFAEGFRSYYESTPVGQLRYPKRLEDLVRDDRFPKPKRHLRKIFIDPIMHRAEWGLVDAPEGGIMGVHSLSVREPLKKFGFETVFAEFVDAKSYSDWVFFYSPAPRSNRSVSQAQ